MTVLGERSSAELRAVTFDVTGTLIECPRLGEIYAGILSRHGRRAVDPEQAAAFVRRAWQEIGCRSDPRRCRFRSHPGGPVGFWSGFLSRVAALMDLDRPSPFAVAELMATFARADAWDVRGEVRELLRALRDAGLRLGVISNWDPRLHGLLEDLGMEEMFDAIVLSSEVGREKPHPLPFVRCLESLGVRAEEALHVGDHRLEDLEGAHAVGMSALLVGARAGEGSSRDPDWDRVLGDALGGMPS